MRPYGEKDYSAKITEYLVSTIKYGVNISEKETVDFVESFAHIDREHDEVLTTETVKVFTKLCMRQARPALNLIFLFHLLFTIFMSLHIMLLVDESDDTY